MKMAKHADDGGNIEVMGLMQGTIQNNSMIVFDAFSLPVEGTETRVNAQEEGYEYMVAYMEKIKASGRTDNVVGWYHSHPGYGCWLSGIDVDTQRLNQQFQEPFVAIVIDPLKTKEKGRVEIGAFRVFSNGYKSENRIKQTVPEDKIEDFGVHANEYYSLDIEYFGTMAQKNLIRQLNKENWSNPLLNEPEDTVDAQTRLAEHITECCGSLTRSLKHSDLEGLKKCNEAGQEICRTLVKNLIKERVKATAFSSPRDNVN